MGCGKTTYMANKIKADKEGSYIYVTPYLDEINRIIEITDHRFKQPLHFCGDERGVTKLAALHKLLAVGENVAMTHALFLMATPETVQLIHEGGYTLVLDEALNIFQEYNAVVSALDRKTVTSETVQWLEQEKLISVSDSYGVEWRGSTVDGFQYSEVERLAKSGSLYCIDNVFYWEYPIEVFRAFQSVYVLTYLFEGSMLSSYLRIHGLDYEKVTIGHSENGTTCLCPYVDDVEHRKALFSRFNIYAGELNNIGKKRSALSVSWFAKANDGQIKEIRNAMRRYKRQMNAPTDGVMWTSTKRYGKEKLEKQKGFKYTRRLIEGEQTLPDDAPKKKKLLCYVPCTARATNDFSDRTTLLYLLNRFPSPEIVKYFARRGYPIDENTFATSEMLQWIWRSAIRKKEFTGRINLYIPSSRMRALLYSWFGIDEPRNLPSTKIKK